MFGIKITLRLVSISEFQVVEHPALTSIDLPLVKALPAVGYAK